MPVATETQVEAAAEIISWPGIKSDLLAVVHCVETARSALATFGKGSGE